MQLALNKIAGDLQLMHSLGLEHEAQVVGHGRHSSRTLTYVPTGQVCTHWFDILFNMYPAWHCVQLELLPHTWQY